MDDVRENDQNLFFSGVNMVLIADTREELDSITETIQTIGNKYLCNMEIHHLQQREALNTALPVGVRQVETMRTMLTRDIAALMPFNVQEIYEPSGLCYGMNRISKNLCVADRKKLTNGNAMVFGVPGSGKSFFCKSEMLGVFLKTDDDILSSTRRSNTLILPGIWAVNALTCQIILKITSTLCGLMWTS